MFFSKEPYHLTPFTEKVLPKRRTQITLDTSVVKSHNASDDASIPAYEFPIGIGGASSRAIIVLIDQHLFQV
jgi:hypothetical protein